MPYVYKLLTEDERDEMLAQTLKAQESDLFAFELNKQRYQDLLAVLPDGDLKKKVQEELPVLDQRIAEVSAIITTLEPQLPTIEKLQAANARIKLKSERAVK